MSLKHNVVLAIVFGASVTSELIGGARKEARLIYLRDYWAKQLLDHDRVRLNTSLRPGFASGIANVRVEGIAAFALRDWL